MVLGAGKREAASGEPCSRQFCSGKPFEAGMTVSSLLPLKEGRLVAYLGFALGMPLSVHVVMKLHLLEAVCLRE